MCHEELAPGLALLSVQRTLKGYRMSHSMLAAELNIIRERFHCATAAGKELACCATQGRVGAAIGAYRYW